MPYGLDEYIIGDTTPAEFPVSGGYSLGLEFHPTANGRVTSIRYYHPTSPPGTTHPLIFWRTSDIAQLARVDDTPPDGFVGWRVIPLATPVDIVSGTLYRTAWGVPNGLPFSHNFAAPASVSPNLVPDSPYFGGTPTSFPSSLGDGHYFSDIIFQRFSAAPSDEPSGNALFWLPRWRRDG